MKFYGLEVLASGIETNKMNYTRFFVIRPQNIKTDIRDYNKVTISLELSHKTGSLNRLLTFFTKNNINLSKIESIPILGHPYRYRFIVDLEMDQGHQFDLLAPQLSLFTESCQILGKYKSAIKLKH